MNKFFGGHCVAFDWLCVGLGMQPRKSAINVRPACSWEKLLKRLTTSRVVRA